jgi:hypothetical protein
LRELGEEFDDAPTPFFAEAFAILRELAFPDLRDFLGACGSDAAEVLEVDPLRFVESFLVA